MVVFLYSPNSSLYYLKFSHYIANCITEISSYVAVVPPEIFLFVPPEIFTCSAAVLPEISFYGAAVPPGISFYDVAVPPEISSYVAIVLPKNFLLHLLQYIINLLLIIEIDKFINFLIS